MTGKGRLLLLLGAVLVLGSVAAFAVHHAVERAGGRGRPQPPAAADGRVWLAAPAGTGRRMIFRNTAGGSHRDALASVPTDRPEAQRATSQLKCLRFSAAGGTGICLQSAPGPLRASYRAVVVDERLNERRSYPLSGVPSRARVSPSGHLVAWTVFVSGDSYGATAFSTRTSVLDTRTGKLQDNLEEYDLKVDGSWYRSLDVNVWGVTFADDGHFYATVSTRGQTYLAKGDIAAHSLTTVHGNVECPSLSPDGTRIAYKKRVPGLPADSPWRLYVLDLRTMTETATAEHRNVDDQAVWATDTTLVYALPGKSGTDLWTVPAHGSGTPQRLASAAATPAFIG
ncbi:TolB-like translocation protein [Streptomyces sp. TM32]|uniref:TolB family protein n=1 Tax=Streptomyces sp. TM32 TaxID=1652669 RepID=UPI001010F327|nr:TolB-like translocation protein [Streptomyces sp. TM32]RXS85350.1 TolB-like translocation protein [Streptomyces sp. TM32]